MITRLLIYAGAIWLGYRGLKSWVRKSLSESSISGRKQEQIHDIMIQDPFCKVYFPKGEGVHVNVGGEDLYFCSAECRDKFFASRSNQKE